MKINPDGTFEMEKGEIMPFICPRDGWPVDYDARLLMVKCNRCGYLGSAEEFTREFDSMK